MEKYHEHSHYIDWQHPDIMSLAIRLSAGLDIDNIVKKCFRWVRDNKI